MNHDNITQGRPENTHLRSSGPLEASGASRAKTRQTIAGIKVVHDTLGQVRRSRRNLGCQAALPTSSRFKNSKNSRFFYKIAFFFTVAHATLEPQAPQAPSAAAAKRRRRQAPQAPRAAGAKRRRRQAPQATSAAGAKRRRRQAPQAPSAAGA